MIGNTIGGFIADRVASSGEQLPGELAFLGEAEKSANKYSAVEENRLYNQLTPEGAQFFDQALARGTSPYSALAIASDRSLRDPIAAIMTMGPSNFGSPTASALGLPRGDTIESLNGSVEVALQGKMPGTGEALAFIGDIGTRIKELRADYHVDDIMLGIQVLLGPTAAIKALAKSFAGDQLLGNMIDSVSNAASSRVTQLATGSSLGGVQFILGADQGVLANTKPEDRTALSQAHDFYGRVDSGAKTLLSTALGVLLGIRNKGGAAESGPRIIEGVDASTLARSHSIEGGASSRSVDRISTSMRNDGYVGAPIDVIEHNGGMIIVDGHHRTAAAMRTGTPVNVRVLPHDAIPDHPSAWSSADEIIRSSQTVGPNRLIPPGKYRR